MNKQFVSIAFFTLISNSVMAVEVDYSSIIKSQWATNIDGGDTDALMISALPEVNVHFGNDWQLTGKLRVRGDLFDETYPGAIRRDGFSDVSKPALMSDHFEVELREFYFEGELADTFVTLGKQQVVWGKSDGLKVLDIVNPQSFNEFILDDFESSRIPLWTINVEQTIGEWDVQFLWIPDKTYHALPKQDAPFAFTSSELVPVAPPGVAVNINDADRPDRFFKDSDAGLRLASFIGGWDISVNYLYQFNNLPTLYQDISAGPTVNINPEYERTHVIGGTFSNAFGDFVVRGELGYFSDRYYVTDQTLLERGIAETPELNYVLGLDWTGIDDVFISAQLFQSWLTDYQSNINRDELDTTLTFLYRQDFLYETVEAEVLIISNLNHGDGLVRSKITYEWNSELTTWLGVDIFYGSDNGLYGQFSNNDRFVVGAELAF